MIIGFIGLGHMGNPMAHNLLKNGYKVIVHDVNSDAVKTIAKDGAIASSSLKSLAEESEVIIISVQTGQQVSDLCLSADGIFAHD